MSEILVTGMGIVSALGNGKTATFRALEAEKSAIGNHLFLKTSLQLPIGEVPYNNEELKQLIGYPSDKLTTRTILLGCIALQEALEEGKIPTNTSKRIAFISATTVGGMDKVEENCNNFLSDKQLCKYLNLQNCGANTSAIAEQYGGKFDYITTISTACSSAANAIILGANMIKMDYVDIAIVGGSECLSKFHLNGFNTLMILDKNLCRPFDANRKGLNLGEGAAYLLLESEKSAKERNVNILCKLSGYGNACDAFHQTASSPDGEGPFLAMQEALKESNLKSEDIDYVNAHGTGTSNNDESEGMALKRIFGNKMPLISSTKPFTGHCTSAAGSIESVISILCLRNKFVPANLHFKTESNIGFSPVIHNIYNQPLQHVMNNSFGFGGNDSSCIFSKY